MNVQISMEEYLRREEPPVKVEIPVAKETGEKVYTIPQDVWETRCRICTHKHGAENIPVPLWAVHMYRYEALIPCKIMSISRPNDRPGECMSFRPKIFKVKGICESCVYNNQFAEGFCTKKDHAEQHRVYWGGHFGGDARNIDYWGRHTLSVCDDYEPHRFIEEENT